MKLHRLVALLAVLALAVFTGTAVAGGGDGNGGGDKSSKQSSTSASQPATGGDNSHGVKPSNSTKHDTYAKASSDKTKQYGNGQTAGQIATKAGYGDATLHGPGNSQPHKTAACPGGHEVDVHALKHKSGTCESSSQVKSEQKTVLIQPVVAVQPKVPCPTTAFEVKGSESNGDSNHEFRGQETGNNGGGNDDNDESDNDDDESGELAANCAPAAPAVAAVVAASTPAAQAAVAVSQSPATPAAQPAPVATPAPAATPAPTAAAAGTAVASAPAPAAAGGVKGAVVALHPTKTKPSGGVLGATTRLGGTVASTRLPFTGLPLWIFAGVALALIGIGLAFRRASANRI